MNTITTERPSRLRKYLITGGICLGVLALLIVCFVRFGLDPAVAKASNLHDQMVAPGPKSPELKAAYQESVQDLNPQQMRDFMKENMRRRTEEHKRFFALSKEEQTAYLDRIIDINKANQTAKANTKVSQPPKQNRSRPVGMGNSSTMGSSNGGGQSAEPASNEDREKDVRNFLDSITAEDRELSVRYRTALIQRYSERNAAEKRR